MLVAKKKEERMLEWLGTQFAGFTRSHAFRALALFDMDGTMLPLSSLKSGNNGHARAIFGALDKVCGIKDASLDGINYHGFTDTQIVYALLEKYGIEKNVNQETLFAIFAEMARFHRAETANIDICPLPGVKELLSTLLRNGVVLGVVTGAIKEIARLKLRKAGLTGYFKIRVFGDQALLRSDLVRLALRQNEENNWAPENRVFLFGDTPKDIEAGKVCRVKTIGVATGLVSREELAKTLPDYLFDDLTDTALLLKTILG